MKKLALYLLRTDTSQTAFAEEIGVNQSTVNRLVSGAIKDPVISVVLAIKKATKGEILPEHWTGR